MGITMGYGLGITVLLVSGQVITATYRRRLAASHCDKPGLCGSFSGDGHPEPLADVFLLDTLFLSGDDPALPGLLAPSAFNRRENV